MEERKAASVERTKKRAALTALQEIRNQRAGAAPPVTIPTDRLAAASDDAVDAFEKCDALNSYFAEYLAVHSHLLAEEEVMFPLHGTHFFKHSEYRI